MFSLKAFTFKAAASLLVFSSLAHGQEDVRVALEKLITQSRSEPAQFDAAVTEARAAGIEDQGVMEALLVRAITRGEVGSDFDEVIEGIEILAPNWNYGKSVLLTSSDKVDSNLALLRTRKAYLENDDVNFEKYAKETYWLDPELAGLISPWIEKHRMTEKLKTLRVPMAQSFTTSSGEQVALNELAAGNKAILLDFWASWCGPCMQLMPELVKKQKKYSPQGVAVVGMNIENTELAEKTRKDFKIDFPWLVEGEAAPLRRQLNITSFPHMVLLSPEGEVLFMGHPQDPSLNVALSKVGLTL